MLTPLLRLRNNHVSKVATPLFASSHNCIRAFSSAAPLQSHDTSLDTSHTDVTVIGGGITGLTSAYYLAKADSKRKITLLEGQADWGGWIRSRKIQGEGEAVFEEGPRSLRPVRTGGVTLQLIQELGLVDDLVFVDKNTDAAKKRYIYYNGEINQLPPWNGFVEGFRSFLTRPIWPGCTLPLISEAWRDVKRSTEDDESIGNFITRRFSRDVAERFASAMIHGIYAGNIWKLSAASIFPRLIEYEKRYDSVIQGMLTQSNNKATMVNDNELRIMESMRDSIWDKKISERVGNCSVFYLKGGMQSLAQRLVNKLTAAENVDVRTNAWVKTLRHDPSSDNLQVTFQPADGKDIQLSSGHVISTQFSKSLAKICLDTSGKTLLPSLSNTHAVDVMTVNLQYVTNVLPPDLTGFGYLIPEAVGLADNPERALGVVFDSNMHQDQNATRLTVMIGGHHWDGWEVEGFSQAELQDIDGTPVQMASAVVQRHLGISEKPVRSNAAVHRNCIPQYNVGHITRMAAAHREIESAFKGRLSVAGNSYTGVSVNDCISAGKSSKGMMGKTGLELFESGKVELHEVPKEAPFWT